MLRGADQVTNVVLEDVEERILSTTNGMEVDKYDVYLFRGDDMYGRWMSVMYRTMIGLYNEETDKEIDWNTIRADTINPIQHLCVCFKHFHTFYK